MIEPCCPPNLCDCRPERVRYWLHEIRVARLSNYDPVLIAREYAHPRGERSMGRSASRGHGGTGDELMVIAILEHLPRRYSAADVQQLAQDVDGLALKLCPFSCYTTASRTGTP